MCRTRTFQVKTAINTGGVTTPVPFSCLRPVSSVLFQKTGLQQSCHIWIKHPCIIMITGLAHGLYFHSFTISVLCWIRSVKHFKAEHIWSVLEKSPKCIEIIYHYLNISLNLPVSALLVTIMTFDMLHIRCRRKNLNRNYKELGVFFTFLSLNKMQRNELQR